MKRNRKTGKTDDGRTMLSKDKEEPKCARSSKEYYKLWKFVETLNLDEIECLITKRRKDVSYKMKEIKTLRTEISILEDAHRIIKRRRN
jgi:hypothetical protein